jgi:hypothetical protein
MILDVSPNNIKYFKIIDWMKILSITVSNKSRLLTENE